LLFIIVIELLTLVWFVDSSMVLRDLTLRSASSFGAFHLIRLLFDEYISYTIEHKVAAATGVSSVAAFGDIKQVHVTFLIEDQQKKTIFSIETHNCSFRK
jgi:hypothetical protein